MNDLPVTPAIPSSEPAPAVASEAVGEPLPIWFFVGLILLVYGVIILASGFFIPPRDTVLAHTRPALWWGAIMTVGGAIFLGVGLKGRRQ